MNTHFLKSVSLKTVAVVSLLVIGICAPLSAQKTLNSTHQLDAEANLPKVVKRDKKRRDTENEDYKPTGQAAAALKRQAAAENAAKAAEVKAAAEAKARTEAIERGEIVDSTIYRPSVTDIEISLFDQAPVFPGGMAGLSQFIADNLNYPRLCEQQKIEGRVTCQMIISSEGKILDVHVVRGVHPLLDAEAVRILKAMPAWQPAMLNGVPVNCRHKMPVFLSYRD